jgi:hypothetical protein
LSDKFDRRPGFVAGDANDGVGREPVLFRLGQIKGIFPSGVLRYPIPQNHAPLRQGNIIERPLQDGLQNRLIFPNANRIDGRGFRYFPELP